MAIFCYILIINNVIIYLDGIITSAPATSSKKTPIGSKISCFWVIVEIAVLLIAILFTSSVKLHSRILTGQFRSIRKNLMFLCFVPENKINWVSADKHWWQMLRINKRITGRDGQLSIIAFILTVRGSHFCILNFILVFKPKLKIWQTLLH